MPSSTWKDYISSGLVSVPIRLYSAARYSHVAFHEIHRECGTRVHQQLYCPTTREWCRATKLPMGYEVEKDGAQEPAAALLDSDGNYSICEAQRGDPIYFETSYFSVPEEAGTRAYALLLEAMQQMKYAALAKVAMHQREREWSDARHYLLSQ